MGQVGLVAQEVTTITRTPMTRTIMTRTFKTWTNIRRIPPPGRGGDPRGGPGGPGGQADYGRGARVSFLNKLTDIPLERKRVVDMKHSRR